MRKLAIYILFIFVTAGALSAEIVVNEVMANEPSSFTSLEWVELYNDSLQPVSLAGYELAFATTTVTLPDSITLEAGEYFIVCSKLFLSGSTPGFESYWGDSSSVWGDNPFEQSIQQPFESNFPLINTGGSVVLLKNQVGVSGLFWDSSGIDGTSWERINPKSSIILQSVARSGSTPGKINSVTPVPIDLALDSILVAANQEIPNYTFYVTNRGMNQINNSTISINYTAFPQPTPILIVDVPTVNVGEQISFSAELSLAGMYVELIAYNSSDNRSENDTLYFTSVGDLYPPLIINEFLANPTGTLNSEWIELKNISNTTVDLVDWFIGDLNQLYSITSQSTLLPPDGYVVLAQNSFAFESFYTEFNSLLIQPSQWPTLNNTGDLVILKDNFNILADNYEFFDTFSDNFSWSKSERTGSIFWGRSSQPGGTPGDTNVLIVESGSGSLEITVDPTHFSPDGDGFNETTQLLITAPEASGYTVKIYDRQGRKVRTLVEDDVYIPYPLEWDGYNDEGSRLPIGIYIVFVEAEGVESRKATLVIAR